MALREELSFRGYAKKRGCSHTAVENAVKRGRLKRCLLKRGDKILIDPAVADREWSQNTDEAFQRDERAGGTPKGSKPANTGKTKQDGLYGVDAEQAAQDAANERGSGTTEHGPTPARMRGVLLGYQAQLAKVQLEEKTGALVRASEIQAESFRLGRALRDALLRIPARCTGPLMAETDAHAFERRLTQEILNALEVLSGKTSAEGQ